ncbi:hypothetical protein PR202_gb24867 [Eleusine coracana subsp. coracana]|uniref:ATP-dependent DNA helicase n=1 Tax=Eleusine coracana subsp. coracana TaxID=191504 RepID=A0AAV5FN51_ELECO|nr:hypothetical protein PR202_gb24867 [Eleusine coracana subsp. coracana]
MEPESAGSDVSADALIAELLDMGFEFDGITAAIAAVGGPRRAEVLEHVLGGSSAAQTRRRGGFAGRSAPSRARPQPAGKGARVSNPRGRFRQSSITDLLASGASSRKDSGREASTSLPCSATMVGCSVQDGVDTCSKPASESQCPVEDLQGEWDHRDKLSAVLQKHFGFSCLKKFQMEALDAWPSFAHMNDGWISLMAGKSLCFQIPALLTTKIVVVISPLISLMHDQCLKLAKHGISACFLGSGQPDSRVEGKAMAGLYKIIYVCPETVLRLLEPLKKLAEKPGIALFAIDEVHCVSKWGHDFRPDYRKLSMLRENFSSSKLKFLKHNIPLMALTATATVPVREDIVKSLKMSDDTVIVLTTFFRSNLRFTVKNSKTSASSYVKDFQQLILTYNASRNVKGKNQKIIHEIDPDSESSSNESLCDSVSDYEDENVNSVSYGDKNVGKSRIGTVLMPKSHLRQVHHQFHCNELEVVVATIAFGMGIDKSNVRRIIHYGYPQSLEAYYQEAGRAGRDGKLSDCILYCNFLRAPRLLPNKRSEEQTKVAYRMLSDCFHYALNTSTCRAKILVKYFGEEFGPDGCHVPVVLNIIYFSILYLIHSFDLRCDICINGPPQKHDFKEESVLFMNVLLGQMGHETDDMNHNSVPCYRSAARRRFGEAPNFRMVVSYIREKRRVSIQYPELTEDGLNFLRSQSEEEVLYEYPDAAMLLAMDNPKPFSTLSEWGRGWADPEIRRQRLAGRKTGRRKRKRRSRQQPTGFTTARERLAAILSKRKR